MGRCRKQPNGELSSAPSRQGSTSTVGGRAQHDNSAEVGVLVVALHFQEVRGLGSMFLLRFLHVACRSSSANVAEVAAEWRPPPSKSHWWVQLLSDTVVAKMKVFFARTLPKSASLPRSLPSSSPRSPGDWRSDGSSVGSGGGSGAGAGVSLASRVHGEVRNRFNFSGLLEAFVQRCGESVCSFTR